LSFKGRTGVLFFFHPSAASSGRRFLFDWRKLYKAALLETDLSMQGEFIRAAELAISEKGDNPL
jgi:hypothetical protein